MPRLLPSWRLAGVVAASYRVPMRGHEADRSAEQREHVPATRDRPASDQVRGARCVGHAVQPPGLGSAASLLQLQRTVGNAAVAGILQRAPLSEPAAAPNPGNAPACDPATDAAVTEFMSKVYEPKPALGIFDAEYQPAQGLLRITVGIDFYFRTGDRSSSTWISSVGGSEKAALYRNDEFIWTPDEAVEWTDNAIAQITEPGASGTGFTSSGRAGSDCRRWMYRSGFSRMWHRSRGSATPTRAGRPTAP